MERCNEITLGNKYKRKYYFVTLLLRYFVPRKGFTLVELIVSVAITGILMLGLSVFFSSTFQSLFKAQTQTVNTEKQYAINEIIRDKFSTIQSILSPFVGNSPPTATELFFRNNNTKDQLPFSYIGTVIRDGKKYLALKDVMIFNKIYFNPLSNWYVDSGLGKIKKADSGEDAPFQLPDTIKNFSSFEIIGNSIYIVLPDKNEVLVCSCNSGVCTNCADLPNMPKFQSPTDITKDRDENFLYISDSGNGRVIKYNVTIGKELDYPNSPVVKDLKYPTGLAYYYHIPTSTEWLFVAETLGNKIRKINLTTPSVISTVVGDGDDKTCSNTAKFCSLNMPTGIFADDVKQELYIADSGNDRILKMSDPGKKTNLLFKFTTSGNYYLDRIVLQNDAWTGGTYDAVKSNLYADDDLGNYYNNSTKTYSNLKRLTAFSAPPCESGDDFFYSNEEPDTLDIKTGDMLYITNNSYNIGSIEKKDCKVLDEDPELSKWKISFSTSIPVVGSGVAVPISNPKDIEIQINGVSALPIFKGFQTTKILIYDFEKGLVDTQQVVDRVGDGILGTDEDTIEVLVAKNDAKYTNPAISFPTGLTNSYFANSGTPLGQNQVIRLDNAIKNEFKAISIQAFDAFDYVSDFTLDPSDPVKFNLYTYAKGTLLDLVIKAYVDLDKTQTYTLNAYIPK